MNYSNSKSKIPVIHPNWILDSVAKNELQNEMNYRLKGTYDNNQTTLQFFNNDSNKKSVRSIKRNMNEVTNIIEDINQKNHIKNNNSETNIYSANNFQEDLSKHNSPTLEINNNYCTTNNINNLKKTNNLKLDLSSDTADNLILDKNIDYHNHIAKTYRKKSSVSCVQLVNENIDNLYNLMKNNNMEYIKKNETNKDNTKSIRNESKVDYDINNINNVVISNLKYSKSKNIKENGITSDILKITNDTHYSDQLDLRECSMKNKYNDDDKNNYIVDNISNSSKNVDTIDICSNILGSNGNTRNETVSFDSNISNNQPNVNEYSKVQNSSNDQNFVENFFKSSRLHHIGSWKSYYQKFVSDRLSIKNTFDSNRGKIM